MTVTEISVALPIADYDDLRIVDVLPLLSDLTADELAEVEAYELGHKYRTTLLTRIDSIFRMMSPPIDAHLDAVHASVEPKTTTAAPVIDLADYAAHDPRLWRACLIPVPPEEFDLEAQKSVRKLFTRSA